MNAKKKKTLMAALSCWICHANYDEDQRAPLILQCGHCFCKDCLIKIFTSSPPTTLPCPECRHVSLVGNSVSSLPKNFSLLTLLHSNPTAADVTDSDDDDDVDNETGTLRMNVALRKNDSRIDVSRCRNLKLVSKLSEGRRVGVEVWKGVLGGGGGGGAGRQVVVKRVKIGEGMDVEWVMGELEKLRQASMWCRNVCGFHGGMVVDGHLCLVMDKCYGSVQLEMQRNEGRLTLKQILRYFLTLLCETFI